MIMEKQIEDQLEALRSEFNGRPSSLIPLTHGKVAIVDESDFALVADKSWHASTSKGGWYARATDRTTGKTITVHMHRLIMGANSPKTFVDHIDGDGLNNRRSNLRICTHAENMRNKRPHGKSGYKGVVWNKKSGAYHAKIRMNGKDMHLGTFRDPIEGAKKYNEVASKLFGEFARLNKIPTA